MLDSSLRDESGILVPKLLLLLVKLVDSIMLVHPPGGGFDLGFGSLPLTEKNPVIHQELVVESDSAIFHSLSWWWFGGSGWGERGRQATRAIPVTNLKCSFWQIQ